MCKPTVCQEAAGLAGGRAHPLELEGVLPAICGADQHVAGRGVVVVVHLRQPYTTVSHLGQLPRHRSPAFSATDGNSLESNEFQTQSALHSPAQYCPHNHTTSIARLPIIARHGTQPSAQPPACRPPATHPQPMHLFTHPDVAAAEVGWLQLADVDPLLRLHEHRGRVSL